MPVEAVIAAVATMVEAAGVAVALAVETAVTATAVEVMVARGGVVVKALASQDRKLRVRSRTLTCVGHPATITSPKVRGPNGTTSVNPPKRFVERTFGKQLQQQQWKRWWR